MLRKFIFNFSTSSNKFGSKGSVLPNKQKKTHQTNDFKAKFTKIKNKEYSRKLSEKNSPKIIPNKQEKQNTTFAPNIVLRPFKTKQGSIKLAPPLTTQKELTMNTPSSSLNAISFVNKLDEVKSLKVDSVELLNSSLGISNNLAKRLMSENYLLYRGDPVKDKELTLSMLSKIELFAKNPEKFPFESLARLWMYYKPATVVERKKNNEDGRVSILEHLKIDGDLKKEDLKDIKIIGNLDYISEGLVLLTNSDAMHDILTNSPEPFLKKYHIRLYGRMDEKNVMKLQLGQKINGKLIKPISFNVIKYQTRNSWVSITTNYRGIQELRLLFRKLSLRPNRIKRIEFGPYKLGALKSGEIIEMQILPELHKVYYYRSRSLLKEKILQIQDHYYNKKMIQHEEKIALGQEIKLLNDSKLELTK